MPFPSVPRAARNTFMCLVVAAGLVVPVTDAGAQGGFDGGGTPDRRHGRSALDLQLLSRTFDAPSGSWTVVVEGRLDSRALCLPVVFDCVVEPQAVDGATLTDVECLSPRWNHLLFFTDRCIKQALFAGHDQKFEFTYVTDPDVAPDRLDIDVRFGRGFLPVIVRELTNASLEVELTASADVLKQCPAVTVQPGEAFECEITVGVPDPDAPTITVAEVTDSVDPSGLVTGAGLTIDDDPDWSCTDLTCTLTGSIEPGDELVFTYRATAATTQDGGTFENTATLDYDVGPDSFEATSSDEVTVVGELDTDLLVEKVAETATVRPGEPVSWLVTVTNEGLSADDVVLTDVVDGPVDALAISYIDGPGTWECAAGVCSTASMPAGVAKFRVTGTIAADASPGVVVNQVDVVWTNDVFGPDHPAVAGAPVEVLGAVVVPVPTAPASPAASVPSRLAFTG